MNAREDWLGKVKDMLHEVLPDSPAVAGPDSLAWQPDLLLRHGRSRIIVEVRTIRGPRVSEAEGQVAKGILRLQRYGGGPGRIPLVILGLAKLGSKLEGAVRAFMGEYAPDIGWGLLDERGRAVVEIPALTLKWEREPRQAEEESSPSGRRDRQLFTDLNRWMLKVLLLRLAPRELWGGPREMARHPTELARVAGVSVGKAHRFSRAFHEEGYLRKTPAGLRLVRVPALLEAWLQSERAGSPRSIPVRPIVPQKGMGNSTDDGGSVLPTAAWSDAALGGVSAAGRMGLLRVAGQQVPRVHVRIPLKAAIGEWGLERCEMRDARLILSQPLFAESVMRGIVRCEEGVSLVDVWQVALDSISSAARGREQADYIVERILAWEDDA